MVAGWLTCCLRSCLLGLCASLVFIWLLVLGFGVVYDLIAGGFEFWLVCFLVGLIWV